jgi:hypothetical protein
VIDFADPKWNLAERIKRQQDRHGLTYAEAEALVKKVIEEKEGPHDSTTV